MTIQPCDEAETAASHGRYLPERISPQHSFLEMGRPMERDRTEDAEFPASAKLDPVQLDRLGDIDDVVFPAIDGDPSALAIAAEIMKSASEQCDRAALRESRRQYLRYAETAWRALHSQATRNPVRIAAVLKIIAILNWVDW